MSSFWQLSQEYPYNKPSKKHWLLAYILLRAFPAQSFPKMNIERFTRHAYHLSSHAEFLNRYYASKTGFEKLWSDKPRQTKEDIEHFYQEHDADIWRQAFLGGESYEYKKKILRVYHIVRDSVRSFNEPILDYGGGAGVMVRYLAAKGYKNVDIADIPSKTLDFVRSEMSPFLRNVIAATGLEAYPSNEYGAIITLDCLEHTTEPLAITKRLLAALRPGGVFIVNFPKEEDFSHAHLEQAQKERDEVFILLERTCDVLVPQYVYRKK